jgi:hypothetical protein
MMRCDLECRTFLYGILIILQSLLPSKNKNRRFLYYKRGITFDLERGIAAAILVPFMFGKKSVSF